MNRTFLTFLLTMIPIEIHARFDKPFEIFINRRDAQGYSALDYICIKGHGEALKPFLALQFGTINPQTGKHPLNILSKHRQTEKTPLHFAAEHGHTDIVTALQSKFYSQLHLTPKDNDGNTYLLLAYINNKKETFDTLLINAKKKDLLLFNNENKNILSYAIEKNDRETIKKLKDRGIQAPTQ